MAVASEKLLPAPTPRYENPNRMAQQMTEKQGDSEPTAFATTEPSHWAGSGQAHPKKSGVYSGQVQLVCEPGRVYGSNHRVKRLLAYGGMAQIYEAEQIVMHRQEALKVLIPRWRCRSDIVQRMAVEARALAEASHLNEAIVKIYDAGTDPEVGLYIAMELLSGRNLREIMSAHGRIPANAAIKIAMDIAEATHKLHALGIFHRDIKPENVFLARDERGTDVVKMLDLGAAKTTRYGARTTEHNRTVGTARYMSPEHISHGKITAASDQYSLGHMLYEMLLGRHAFGANHPGLADNLEFCGWQLYAEPEPLTELLPGFPEPLWQTIHRALRKAPAERFGTMLDFRRALAESLPRVRQLAREGAPPVAQGGSTTSVELLEAALDADARRAPSPAEGPTAEWLRGGSDAAARPTSTTAAGTDIIAQLPEAGRATSTTASGTDIIKQPEVPGGEADAHHAPAEASGAAATQARAADAPLERQHPNAVLPPEPLPPDAPRATAIVVSGPAAGRTLAVTTDRVFIGWWPSEVPAAARLELDDPAAEQDYGVVLFFREGAWWMLDCGAYDAAEREGDRYQGPEPIRPVHRRHRLVLGSTTVEFAWSAPAGSPRASASTIGQNRSRSGRPSRRRPLELWRVALLGIALGVLIVAALMVLQYLLGGAEPSGGQGQTERLGGGRLRLGAAERRASSPGVQAPGQGDGHGWS